MTSNRQNETKLQALTPAEMCEIQGGRRDDGNVTCWISPNKVINDDSVWYKVPCDDGGR